MQGGDGNYGAQFLIGMTTNQVYHRTYMGGGFGSWNRIAYASECPHPSFNNPILQNYNTGGSYSWSSLISDSHSKPVCFTNWSDTTNLPGLYGSGIALPCLDGNCRAIIYIMDGALYARRTTGGWYRAWSNNNLSFSLSGSTLSITTS